MQPTNIRQFVVFFTLLFISLLPGLSQAQQAIPTPESVFGFKVGADYHLIDYEESIDYFKKLDAASNRMKIVQVGYTSFGRPWYMSVISTPENLANLEQLRQISQQIAHPKGLTPEEAKKLVKDAPVFVDINGGLHASEIAGSQHTNQLAYNLLSWDEAKFRNRFNKMVLFLWPTINPDGQDIVVHWYREIKDTEFKNAPLHRLYQKYVGHDNARDGYMLNVQESKVQAHTWRHWEPQIIHVHHQFGRGFGKNGDFHRMWLPPFAPPVAFHTPYLMLREMNALGMRMAMELESHGLQGSTNMGKGYDAYYAGYNDYVGMFQNIVSYWTEVASSGYANPAYLSPDTVKKYLKGYRPRALYASPWEGGWWRLRDQVDYMLVADYGVLKFASNNRKQILYNRYQAGMNAIEHYSNHAPYAYIIPQKQWDPMAAVEMLRRLAFNRVRIYQLKQEASMGGTAYPAGTWVIPMNQEYGRLVEEVLEVQHYPHIEEYPGGPLERPYDAAGWTLPYSMNVDVVAAQQSLSDAFLAAMEPVKGEPAAWDETKTPGLLTNSIAAGIIAPAGTLQGSGSILALNPAENNSYTLINRALAGDGVVTYARIGIVKWPGGNYLISGIDKNTLEAWVSELGLHAQWVDNASGAIVHPQIGIYSSWTANMDEGWTRWVLDKYGFQYSRIRNDEIQEGNLGEKYDAIIFASAWPGSIINGYSAKRMPAPYAGGIGEKGVQALQTYVQNGGTLVALNQSTAFAINQFDLPVKSTVKDLKNTDFFVGGSLLKITTNQNHPVMAGMPKQAAVFFSRSPVFKTLSGFEGDVLATYPAQDSLLLSGYLMGAKYLKGNAAALDAHYGNGHIILIGFRPQWRGQTFGTFRILFNALLFDR